VFDSHVRYRNQIFSICLERIIRIDPSFMVVACAYDLIGQYSLKGDRAIWSLGVSKDLFACNDLI
jgi:hypothetical protein